MRFRLRNFGRKNKATIEQEFAALPPNVTLLDFDSNLLSLKTGAEIAQIFAAIPPGVTAINLSGNGLGRISPVELAQAFRAIPPHVNRLNLSVNDFGANNGAAIVEALTGIPEHIQEITLSLATIETLSDEELVALGNALPYVLRINFLEVNGHIVANEKTRKLISHIGKGFLETYRGLHNHMPVELSCLVSSVQTGAKESEIKELINPKDPVAKIPNPLAAAAGFFARPLPQNPPTVAQVNSTTPAA